MKTQEDYVDPRILEQLDQLKDISSRDPAARARGRVNFLAEVKAAATSTNPEEKVRPSRWRQPILVLNLRTVAIAFGLVLGLTILLAFSGSVVTAYAQSALPGDFLYGLKSASEDARVSLSSDSGAVAELQLQFAERRIEEIRGLIEQGRYENIEFAANQFESHIYRALGAVGLLTAEDPGRAEEITAMIFSSLSDYTQALLVLSESLPLGQPQTALDQAVNASQFQFMNAEIEFTGIVETLADDQWTIGGRSVGITLQTEIKSSLTIDDLAEVHAIVDADGKLTARVIEPAHDDDGPGVEFEYTGVVEAIIGNEWTVGGQLVRITILTELDDGIAVGDLVKVEGELDEEGNFIAREIKHADEGDRGADDEGGADNDGGDENENGDGNDGNENEDSGDDPSDDSDDDGNDSGDSNGGGDDDSEGDADDEGGDDNEGDDNGGGDEDEGDESGGDDNESGDDDEEDPEDEEGDEEKEEEDPDHGN